jgi:beta-phosphoglucomutase-like phosphatase (HAD superfamily)
VLFPGAENVVRRAAARVPLAIASAALDVEIRRVLDRSSLTSAFAAIASADGTMASKPAPDLYLRALALLAHHLGSPLSPASCLAIEDSKWGIIAAKSAGLRTIAVMHTYAREELMGADLVIPSIADLDLDVVERLCSS